MIQITVFEKAEGESHRRRTHFRSAEAALVELVDNLNGDTGISSIGPKGLTLNCPSTNERIEFQWDQEEYDDGGADRLLHVGHLYLQARPWLSDSSIVKMIGE
ncbi:MAG: hypothetical protein AAB646_01145 [Patescibacteria group bacterium]